MATENENAWLVLPNADSHFLDISSLNDPELAWILDFFCGSNRQEKSWNIMLQSEPCFGSRLLQGKLVLFFIRGKPIKGNLQENIPFRRAGPHDNKAFTSTHGGRHLTPFRLRTRRQWSHRLTISVFGCHFEERERHTAGRTSLEDFPLGSTWPTPENVGQLRMSKHE